MKSNIQHKESLQLADGKQAILTIKELPTGECEVSLKSIESRDTINVNKYFTNKTEALNFMEYLRNKCHTSKGDKDYKQLAKDIRQAMDFAKDCVDNYADTDVANRYQDTMYIILNGWDKNKVMDAVKSTGIYCQKIQRASQDAYSCLLFEQGSRTKIAELMSGYLRARGYETYVSYTLD